RVFLDIWNEPRVEDRFAVVPGIEPAIEIEIRCARNLARSSRWKPGPGKGKRPLGSECCVVEGDDHGEAYTAILWGVGLSHESNHVAGAETFVSVEGNMCGAAMRGPVALPGSEATSRKKGTRRNLGDLTSPAAAKACFGATPTRCSRRSRPRPYGLIAACLVILWVYLRSASIRAPLFAFVGFSRHAWIAFR